MQLSNKYPNLPAVPTTFSEIALCLPDKTAAINLIYYRYATILYDTIFRIVKIRELAEDLRQECLLKIWTSLEQYNADKGQFTTWILSIARHLAIDKIRSKAYRKGLKNINLNKSKVCWLPESSNFRPENIGVQDLTHL